MIITTVMKTSFLIGLEIVSGEGEEERVGRGGGEEERVGRGEGEEERVGRGVCLFYIASLLPYVVEKKRKHRMERAGKLEDSAKSYQSLVCVVLVSTSKQT